MNPLYSKRYQFKILTLCSLGIALLGTILYSKDPLIYQSILGQLHPQLSLLITILACYLLFVYLLSNSPLQIYKNIDWRAMLLFTGIALVFGMEVIAADLWWADYPADLNTDLPEALLYYPVMGFMAEVVFHLIPLAFFIFLFSLITHWNMNRILWVSIVVSAFAEPFFQVLASPESDDLTRVYTGIHVFLFSLVQLWVFKKYDFVSMFIVRLLFYAIWHIGWGSLRLEFVVVS